MPREAPAPPKFEPNELDRSLDRYLMVGLVFMAVLIAGFVVYRAREPSLRKDAAQDQAANYTAIGTDLFAKSCQSCHGVNATGGSAPVLNAKEFLSTISDGQIAAIIRGGITGSDMPAWGLDYGGTFTDEQVNQLTSYLRSLAKEAPSVPNWRRGKTSG